MAKTIFILADGCGWELASQRFGYLEHLAETKQAAKYMVMGELPSMSRPMYELLLTGLPVSSHGIFNNAVNRRSHCDNIFSLCRDRELSTAAAAYHWISELYQKSPFSPDSDRVQLQSDKGWIQNGMYYFEDHYPDTHLMADANFLLQSFQPDFLMVHTMNVDDTGHRFGALSKEHAQSACLLDVCLSTFIPGWLQAGYRIVITADHGMDEKGLHGGNTPVQRQVPLYLLGDGFHLRGGGCVVVPQLAVAPLLCASLEIQPPDHMMSLESLEVDFFEK